MKMATASSSLLVILALVCCCTELSRAQNITYNNRAIVIDGKPRILISGSIHYPRSTPEMWPDLIKKSKEGGLDVIDTYVFWDLHEPVQGQYDFEGRKDLVRFIKAVADAGLYVHLRIGPYVCAEWNFGGFPLWLHFVPGIAFRTDNEPFKREMQKFTTKIVDLMKQEKLFASQGGPIILSQIENEYGDIDSNFGAPGKTYMKWSASMAVALDTGVPWVMCQQSDAPEAIINTCNGFYCDAFTPNSNATPKMWTENWSGWFLSFGGLVPYRPVEDLAFAVARFYQRGGVLQNYYMYHGGTNFGRTAGGPFIATSYDYDAPIDEYGIVRQPKWGHLRDLHKAIKLCEEKLVASSPVYSSLGENLESHVYTTASGECAAFLANFGTQSDANVTFNGKSYNLPAWSVSILPDCKDVIYNTAQINSQTSYSVTKYLKAESQHSDQPTDSSNESLSTWSFVKEPVGISKTSAFTKTGLLEQISTTADASDYLWYSISIEIDGSEPFLLNGTQSNLYVESSGHVLHVFVNGELSGSETGRKIKWEKTVDLVAGKNKIDLLSATVGLQNYGAFFETWGAGITGSVMLKGQSSTNDLSSKDWTYQIGLKGEELGLYEISANQSLWDSQTSLPKNQPLIWYKTSFDAPPGNDPVALDLKGMGKGEVWVNGQSIGRHWPSYISPQTGCSSCDFRGAFKSDKCRKNCGNPSQQLYHVPLSLLQPEKNTLVLFEEEGGDPTQISFGVRQPGNICAHVSESHPAPVDAWTSTQSTVGRARSTLDLECPRPDQVISEIKFASFGNPQGTCGGYSHGECSSNVALDVVRQACIGLKSCSIKVSRKLFGDPCSRIINSLAVEAACI